MARKLFAMAVLGLVCAAAAADDAKTPDGGKPGKPGKGGFDKGKVFDKMDANGDGKVTKDEYAKFADGMADKIKDKTGKTPPAGVTDKLFARLDADGDGSISKAEYEKAEPLAGALGKLKGKAKKATDN